MNKNEIKRDPVAEKIVQFMVYLRKNLTLVLIGVIILFAVVAGISWNLSEQEIKNDNVLKETDKIMIKLISSISNNSIIDTNLKNDIESLYEKYPNSEAVNYLSLLLIRLDSSNNEERINLIKNNVTNDWFKTQAFLISGDYYSDNSDYKSAKKDYKNALKYAFSNAQKGYCCYKLGNIYFELKDLSEAMNYYKKADKLFNSSEKSDALNRDPQFQDWVSRNKIALYRVENLLKK